jgi:hypothetical protein
VPSIRGLSTLKTFEGQRVFGEVSAKRVRLYWVTPYSRNIFRPRFVGRFETMDGKATLVGKIGAMAIAKAFACVIFGFVLIPSAIIVAVNIADGQPVAPLLVPFLTVLVMSLSGFVALHLSQMLAADVRRGLADFLHATLGEVVEETA